MCLSRFKCLPIRVTSRRVETSERYRPVLVNLSPPEYEWLKGRANTNIRGLGPELRALLQKRMQEEP